jgi:Protein of unknown function (DUF3226)
VSDDPCKHDGPTVLLVEGKDDCHVTLALCVKYEIPETFGIYECGSDKKVIQRLNALISSADAPRIIGLVLDADRPDLGGRWSQIRSKLEHYHSYVLPTSPGPDGTIVEPVDVGPRLGFWLMPNNQNTGMLEDFCADMITEIAITGTRECIDIARTKGITTFKDVHYAKAVVHTFLALQDEPGMPLGQSITAQTLRAETPATRTFVTWLIRLFGDM